MSVLERRAHQFLHIQRTNAERLPVLVQIQRVWSLEERNGGSSGIDKPDAGTSMHSTPAG
jgi:hypothetical protein